uniref:Uncharacterized protein n=1 Tax=Anguilla anguilla TaxID=7936 RepID=A0A0E9VVF3_ANGAN
MPTLEGARGRLLIPDKVLMRKHYRSCVRDFSPPFAGMLIIITVKIVKAQR